MIFSISASVPRLQDPHAAQRQTGHHCIADQLARENQKGKAGEINFEDSARQTERIANDRQPGKQ